MAKRVAIVLVLAVVAGACGSSDAGQSSESRDSSENVEESPVASNEDPPPTVTGGFTVVLPEAPEGEVDGASTGVPGLVLEPERVTGEIYVWCDDLTLNPRDDAPIEAGVVAAQGDVFTTGQGAGWYVEFSAEEFSPGDSVELPSPAWDLDFFYVAAVPETSPVVWEFSSKEEESFGTLTLHEIPCQDDGDTLRFSIEGGIGSEKNPGYIAWAEITGDFTGEITGPPDFAG